MRRATTALLVLIALVAAACGGGGSPADRLSSIGKATFEDSFHYAFSMDVDVAALGADGAGPETAQMAAFLDTFGIEGDHTRDATSVAVSVFGLDVFEAISVDEGHGFLRIDASPLVAMSGETPEAVLDQLAGDPSVPDDVRGALLELAGPILRGEWIELDGFTQDEIERLQAELQQDMADLAPEELQADLERQRELQARMQALVQDFVDGSADTMEELAVVTATDADGGSVFDVAIRTAEVRSFVEEYVRIFVGSVAASGEPAADDLTRELADVEAKLDEAFARVPDLLPLVRVTTQDGVVIRYEVDLGRILSQIEGLEDTVPVGAVVLGVDLSQHRQVDAIEIPAPTLTLTPADAERYLDLFLDAFRSGMAGADAATYSY